MLNHHFATRAPNHCNLRAPRARTLCSAYLQMGSKGDRRAPRTERKVLGNPGCSNHASRYRIPQRSRWDHSERTLPFCAESRPGPLRMLSPPRRLPRANERSPLRVLPGAGQGGDGGDRQHPGHEPTGEMESGSGAAEAQQPSFPRQGGPRLSHTRTCEDSDMNQAVCRWGLGCSRILYRHLGPRWRRRPLRCKYWN